MPNNRKFTSYWNLRKQVKKYVHFGRKQYGWLLLATTGLLLCAGALFLADCPVQRFIPMYLVVGGAFALYENLSGFLQSIGLVKDPDRPIVRIDALNTFCKVSECTAGCFMFVWFICGELRTTSFIGVGKNLSRGHFRSPSLSTSLFRLFFFPLFLLPQL